MPATSAAPIPCAGESGAPVLMSLPERPSPHGPPGGCADDVQALACFLRDIPTLSLADNQRSASPRPGAEQAPDDDSAPDRTQHREGPKNRPAADAQPGERRPTPQSRDTPRLRPRVPAERRSDGLPATEEVLRLVGARPARAASLSFLGTPNRLPFHVKRRLLPLPLRAAAKAPLRRPSEDVGRAARTITAEPQIGPGIVSQQYPQAVCRDC